MRASPKYGASLAYKVTVASTALEDISSYASFIRDENKSPLAASRWMDELESQVASLSENPTRFAVIPEADELGFEYRSFVYHSHRVVYAVHEEQATVILHRVYHGARNPLTKGQL